MLRCLVLAQLEGGALGGGALGGVGLAAADLDLIQGAVVLAAAVMGTVGDGALDAVVRGLVHCKFLLVTVVRS